MKTPLKTCPFCGSNETDPISGDRCWIACLTCWAEGPSADSPEEAAERWNDRHFPRAALDPVRLSDLNP